MIDRNPQEPRSEDVPSVATGMEPEEREEESQAPAEEPQTPAEAAEPVRVFMGTGVYVSAVIGFLLAVAVVIFIAQNTDSVSIHWAVWSVEAPLAALVVGAVLVGSLFTVAIGLLWRRRRRRVLSEREELRRLRASREDGGSEPEA